MTIAIVGVEMQARADFDTPQTVREFVCNCTAD